MLEFCVATLQSPGIFLGHPLAGNRKLRKNLELDDRSRCAGSFKYIFNIFNNYIFINKLFMISNLNLNVSIIYK